MSKRPRGKAQRHAPAALQQMADADARSTTTARQAWERDAPAAFRFLLDAEPPLPTEQRDAPQA